MKPERVSPAEAVLLLAPAAGTANPCIQAGLLSLADAGRVVIEPPSGLFGRAALRLVAPDAADRLPGHLAALERSLLDYAKGSRRLVASRVALALQKSFGFGYRRYVHEALAPGLVRRDLLTRGTDKWLGIFPRIRYRRTPGADALVAPVERILAALEPLPSLIAADPDEALRRTRAAGVLLVMSPRARRQIPKLRRLLDRRAEPAAPPAPRGRGEPDGALGDLALGFELETLFDGVQAVFEFTSDPEGGSSYGGGGDGGD